MAKARIPTVLLVDDSEIVRRSAARSLRRKGYTVLIAGTAQEALELVVAHSDAIDLLLTDLVLPGMGGLELVAATRSHIPSIAVAYMTGHLGPSARSDVVLAAGTPVLLKPFTPALLEQSVRETLARAGWSLPSLPSGLN